MTIERTPLDPSQLSPAAQKALGPGPGRMMASRGLVPLPPPEQCAVLYQLSLDADANLANSARATVASLPDKVLTAALSDGQIDPRVLDLFAELVGKKAAALDALVQNPAIADETIAKLAAVAGPIEVDRIAANEQRLLRHPEIIGAMYTNKLARMSTVDRVVELAVRNEVRVPGLHAWDEIARALSGAPAAAPTAEADALFAVVAEGTSGDDSRLTQGDLDAPVLDDDEAAAIAEVEEIKKLPIDKLSIPAKIRLATVGNAFARATLVRDPVRIVAMAAIKSPAVTDIEAKNFARNHSLSEDVIRYIAGKREFQRHYEIKKSLCRNPKTPVAESMRMIPLLRDKDIEALIKSRGVPSAVVAQARKLMMARRGGAKK